MANRFADSRTALEHKVQELSNDVNEWQLKYAASRETCEGLRTALAAAERERDSAKAEVERLRSQTSKNSQVSVVRFEGTGNSCEAVLSLCGGPNPTKCVWKSCTYEGGYLVTPNGATEFVKGDWLLRDESDFLHVLTDPFGYADRKSGKMRDLVVAWLAAEISEGRVCEVSGLDRDLVRIIRDHLIARGKRAASVSEDNALTPTPPQAKDAGTNGGGE